MTGTDEESKVIEPSRKVSSHLPTTTNINNDQRLLNTSSTASNPGSSRYHRDGHQYHPEGHFVDRSTSSSPRSDIRSLGDLDIHRSRSSSLEEEVDLNLSSRQSGRREEEKGLDDAYGVTEIDKSVVTSSSSVVIDEEHANLCLSEEELDLISKDEVIRLYQRLQTYIEEIKRKHKEKLCQCKEIEAKLRAEGIELSKREKALLLRLTMRERQLMEAEKETAILKKSIVPNLGALRSTHLDPAVNLIIQKLKQDLTETKKKLEDTQNDLNAWKFTPDSNTGKRLMAKCRMLYLENEDLGKQTSSGNVAKLENDLALNKQLVNEMKQSQAEMDEVVQELDEDIEGLQSAIQHLQKELRTATERTANTGDIPLTSIPSVSRAEFENSSSEMVTMSSSVLCAQCRLTPTATKVPTSPNLAESTALRTRRTASSDENDIDDDERTPVDQDGLHTLGLAGVENDERTSLLNGELVVVEKSNATLNSSINYRTSVQHVVNSSNSNSPRTPMSSCDDDGDDDDELLDRPPMTKRTKYSDHIGSEVKISSFECHSSSSFNGNGSMNH